MPSCRSVWGLDWMQMLHRTFSRGVPLLLGAFCLGCARDDDPAGPSSFARSDPRTISGRVLGPDGSNICNTVGSGSLFLRLLNPDFTPGAGNGFLGQQDITCPDNRYSLPAPAGTAHLRVELPATEAIDGLPWRNLDEFTVDRRSAAHDVRIVEGTALGGSATLEGSAFEGASLTFTYDLNSNFGAAFGASGPDGAWSDFFGRSPFTLQAGVRYQANCDPVLGTRLLAGAPSGGFLFPDEVSAIDCTMETAPSIEFAHASTRLVVTPMPGDIGGSASSELFNQYGVGWGVQFPVEPGTAPSHSQAASHLFVGGLLITLEDSVLTGVNVNGQLQCDAECRDLGLDGTLKFTTGSTGRQVTWRYSSPTSGLDFTQTSVDGRRPHDYVLFQFTIRNTSRFTRTLHVGFFGDWDMDSDASDDLGFTDLDDRLMYLVSQAESGVHAGTLLLGAPASGNFFFSAGSVPSSFDQVQALTGGVRQETGGPGDLRYIQGAGPITLRRGQQRDVWIAVVAGEDHSQLLANAAAAEAHVSGGRTTALGAASALRFNAAAGAASQRRSPKQLR
jgi:hypothetical protein